MRVNIQSAFLSRVLTYKIRERISTREVIALKNSQKYFLAYV
ncbi:hypothetical protein DOT_0316 [Desulfosporosinus sp. OT]|nr:hypothetical protein DOT_0316 [Desulfosporosinus sp. OT]